MSTQKQPKPKTRSVRADVPIELHERLMTHITHFGQIAYIIRSAIKTFVEEHEKEHETKLKQARS